MIAVQCCFWTRPSRSTKNYKRDTQSSRKRVLITKIILPGSNDEIGRKRKTIGNSHLLDAMLRLLSIRDRLLMDCCCDPSTRLSAKWSFQQLREIGLNP